MIKGLVFDKDGTLFEYGGTWQVWCQRVLHDLSGGDKDIQERLASSVGFDLSERKFMAGSLIVNASAAEINTAWADQLPNHNYSDVDAVAQSHLHNLPSLPVCDLKELFSGLKSAGYKLGIATNDYEAGATHQLQAEGIGDLFDFVCGFDSGHGAKPAAGMILGFCSATGLDVSQVAMIGDSTHDLNAGRNAKVGLNVGVLTGPALAEDIAAFADVILPSIAALPALLADR